MQVFKTGDSGTAEKVYQRAINSRDRVADVDVDGEIGHQTLVAAEQTARLMGVSPYKGTTEAALRRQAVILGAKRTREELSRAKALRKAATKEASKPSKGWAAQRHWLAAHRGLTEQPANSNRDNRVDGITAAQRRLASWLIGLAWCGTWVANGLMKRGVPGASNPALASVAQIEDLARRRAQPFGRGWITTATANWWKKVQPGDVVVLFGRGVHTATVLAVHKLLGYIVTDEGNTGPGNSGSQSNGGGSFKRTRYLSTIHGFALVAG